MLTHSRTGGKRKKMACSVVEIKTKMTAAARQTVTQLSFQLAPPRIKLLKKWYVRCFHWKWSHVQHVYRVIITWISQTDVKGERQQSRIAGVQKNLIMFWSLSNHFTLFLLDVSIYFIQMWIKGRFYFFNKNNFSFSAFILVETVQMPTKTVYYHYLLPHL